MEVLIIGVIWIVVLGGVGYWIAQQKRRSEVEGCALGCLLGPLGWIIEAVLPTGEGTAPQSDWGVAPQPSKNPKPTIMPTSDEWTLRPKERSQSTRPVTGDLIVPWEESADSQRSESGPDGSPPIKRRYMEGSPDAAIHAMQADERAAGARRVVEAVWEDLALSHLAAAFGDPTKTYDLVWPGKPRVRLSTREEAVRAPEQPAGASETAAEDARSAGVPATSDPGEARPTKICPDCAETVLVAARICRFCRHEFWPEDARPPSSDTPDEGGVASSPDASTATDEMPEADSGDQVMEPGTPPEPEPTRPGMMTLEQEPTPPPPAPEPPPAAPQPKAQWQERPPAPPPPTYAPPPPSPAAPYPPPGQPSRPPYAPPPPPPAWRPPPQGQPPGQGPGPWLPPPPTRPPDQPR